MKTIKYALLTLICANLCSCVTSYDRYGNPIQTVDPVAATIGAVAIGAVAYNAGQNDSNYYNRGYYNRSPYSTGGYYPYQRCYPGGVYRPPVYGHSNHHNRYNNRCRK